MLFESAKTHLQNQSHWSISSSWCSDSVGAVGLHGGNNYSGSSSNTHKYQQ